MNKNINVSDIRRGIGQVKNQPDKDKALKRLKALDQKLTAAIIATYEN